METACNEAVRRIIHARAYEIVDQVLLDIWRRMSLAYTHRLAEWELRAWLIGILEQVADSDRAFAFRQFSRPFFWHEAVETVRILMLRTLLTVGGNEERQASLRRAFNLYLIQLGEYYQADTAKVVQAKSNEFRPMGAVKAA